VRDDLEKSDTSQQRRIVADDPVCYRPRYLHNIAVSDVPRFEFTCDHDYYDYYYDYYDYYYEVRLLYTEFTCDHDYYDYYYDTESEYELSNYDDDDASSMHNDSRVDN